MTVGPPQPPPWPALVAVSGALLGAALSPWSPGRGGLLVFAGLWVTELARRQLPRWSPRAQRAVELLPPAALVAAVALTHPFLLTLDPPVRGDHAIHLAKAVWTWTELLPSGRLVGFSDAADFGWPLHALYPPGASWLPLLPYAVTFGALGWLRAYALALGAGLCCAPLGLYALARPALGRGAAFLAGLLAVTQLGTFWQGGYLFDVVVGVWGTSASVGATLAAVALAHRAMRGGLGAWVGAALLFAAALVLHPFALVVVALVGGLRLGVGAWRADDGGPGLGWVGLVRGASALGIGLLVAAGWWLPFGVRSADYALSYGGGWLPLRALLDGLWRGQTLVGLSPVLVAAGLSGLAVHARRQALALACGAAAALSLGLAADEAFDTLGLARVFPGLEELQLQRFAYVLKVVVFLGAATWLGAGAAVAAGWRPVFGGALAAAVVASSPPNALPPFPPLPTTATDPAFAALERLAARLDAERRASPHFFRTALAAFDDADHRLLWLPVLAPGLPVARLSFHAAETFRYDLGGLEPSLLRAQDVRFVVAPAGRAPDPSLRLVATEGPFALLEWAGYHPGERAHVLDAAGVEVPGAVTTERFEPREAVLHVRDVPAGSRLLLHRAPYATFRALRDDAPVALAPTPVGPSLRSQVAGLDAQAGRYVVREVPGLPERGGLALSLLGVVLLVGLRRGAWWAAAERHARAVCGVGLAAVGAVALLGCARAWGLTGAPFSARAWLADAQVSLGGSPCLALGAERGFRCGAEAWQRVFRARLPSEQVMRRCVWAHPTKGRPLVLRWDDVRLGDALVLSRGFEDSSFRLGPGADVTLRLSAGDWTAERVLRPSPYWVTERLDTRGLSGQRRALEVTVETADDRLRQVCFDVAVE